MPLDLQGGLSFTVDGPGGSTAGTVEGDGAVLRVRADDPAVAWDGVLGSVSTGPTALRSTAQALAGEGLSIEVSGPEGRLALIGSEADSSIGRILTGTRRVQLGRPAALRPLVAAQARRGLTPRRVVAGVGAAAVLILLSSRRARALVSPDGG